MSGDHIPHHTDKSIEAYDDPARASCYDTRMDFMHPLRHKMVDIAMQVLPFRRDAEFLALELGSGSGFFTGRFLSEFPRARVMAVDGAPAMLESARASLTDVADRIDYRAADVRNLDSVIGAGERFLLVFSAYTLHHLDTREKRAVVRRCTEWMVPGGWFVNADILSADSALLQRRYQDLRIDGIVGRAACAKPADPVFSDRDQLRAFLEQMERSEGDLPQTLTTDLEILAAAGLHDVAVPGPAEGRRRVGNPAPARRAARGARRGDDGDSPRVPHADRTG